MNRTPQLSNPRRSLAAALFALLPTAAGLGVAPVPAHAQAQEIQSRDAAEARAQGVAPPGMPCQDFLQALGRKPEGVQYLGCEKHEDLQARPMIARYRVAGASAAQVEAYLGQVFAMPPLEFVCCGWGTKPHAWRDERTGLRYGLGMGAETLRLPRAEWDQIPAFGITVSLYTEII